MTARSGAPLLPDPALARRLAERAAGTYDDHARIPDEVGRRLIEHLDPIRARPSVVLDVGAGTGTTTARLRARFPRAAVVALDPSRGALLRARRKAPRWRSRQHHVCAAAPDLPLRDGAVDLVFSNLALPWLGDPDRALSAIARALRPGGLALVSTPGPDTLRELREAWAAADDHVHVHPFLDLHDLGDLLVRRGFEGVVLDAERISVRYADLAALLRDLRGLGVGNASPARPRGLTGRARARRLEAATERFRTEAGLTVTLEVVYAHGWRGTDPRVEIPVERLRPGRGGLGRGPADGEP